MDPLSVSASVLTLLGAFGTATQLLTEYKTSPESLEILDSELKQLQTVADRLHCLAQGRKLDDSESAILQHPFEKLQRIRRSFDARFQLKCSSAAGKLRYRHSMRFKHIKQISDDLVAIKDDFNIAIGMISVSMLSSAKVMDSYKLELSSKFSPEHCVTPGLMMEPLHVYSIIEVGRNAASQTHKYFMAFAQDGRRWRRIVATVIARTNTDFVSPSVFPEPIRSRALGRLQPLFQKTLTNIQHKLLDSASSLQMELDLSSPDAPSLVADTSTSIENPKACTSSKNAEYVAEMYRRGLPVYIESEIEVVTDHQRWWTQVRVGSKHFLERRVPFLDEDSTQGSENLRDYWQSLQPFLMAQNSPFLGKCCGFILDDTRTQLLGHLIEMPERGPFVHILRAAELHGISIPWQYREKWVRQLITAAAESHRRGFVLGDFMLPHIWIDGNDDLVVVQLKQRTQYLQRKPGNVPPEFRTSSLMPNPAAEPGQSLTYASDIFFLGFKIWLICQQREDISVGEMCSMYPCTNTTRNRCAASHSNPIDLPPFANALQVPPIMETIIGLCRQERPDRRLPADRLLQMLPTGVIPELRPIRSIVPVQSNSPELKYSIMCDECGAKCTLESYTCRICEQGSLELCPGCYSRGVRCPVAEHRFHCRRLWDGEWIYSRGRLSTKGS